MSEETVRYRRWPALVGGDSNGVAVPESAWGHHRSAIQAVRKVGYHLSDTTGDLDLSPQPVGVDIYVLKKLTVGATRLVLKAFVCEGTTEPQALEIIWDRLLEQVGA